MSSVMSGLILLPFLSVALHESGSRNTLFHDLTTLKFIWPPLIVLNITQLQDIYVYNLFLLASKQEWTALQRLVFLTVSYIRLLQINFICSNNVHNCLCSMGVLRFVYLREFYLCSPLLLTSVYVWFVWTEGHLMNINGFKQMNLLYFL